MRRAARARWGLRALHHWVSARDSCDVLMVRALPKQDGRVGNSHRSTDALLRGSRGRRLGSPGAEGTYLPSPLDSATAIRVLQSVPPPPPPVERTAVPLEATPAALPPGALR
jgi:hypothetical protein